MRLRLMAVQQEESPEIMNRGVQRHHAPLPPGATSVFRWRAFLAVLVYSVSALSLALPFLPARTHREADLRVLEVRLDPVRQGKNVVYVRVQNTSPGRQPFVIAIQSRSPDYGRGIGWGTRFTEFAGPLETKEMRFAYQIYGPVTDEMKLSLSFYNPTSPDNIDPQSYFDRKTYLGRDLERYHPSPEPLKPASRDQSEQIISMLRQTQNAFISKNYHEAWESFTRDFRAINFCQTEAEFLENIIADESVMKPFLWPVERFLSFTPGSAFVSDDGRIALADANPGQDLRMFFAQDEGRWRVDEISGYVPQAVVWATWQDTLLPKLRTKRTEHFDLYFYPESTAEREIERIRVEREKGYGAIAEFLGTKLDVRIRLVFFEDGRTKYWETGHRGAGWAFDRTIVEVFNQTERLDPFHEVCHILANLVGDPPALFNEGLAVYMSERLGAPALKSLGGGTLPIDDRVRELKSRNQWVALEALIRFSEIGSDKSRPDVAYPEAASFVKFLVERFGREKFLAAYKTLKSSSNPAVQEANLDSLRKIYGLSVPELAAEWEEAATAPTRY